LQCSQLSDFGRERGEPIAGKVKGLQCGQLSQFWGKRGQQVAAEGKRLQTGQLTDLWREMGQSLVAEVKFRPFPASGMVNNFEEKVGIGGIAVWIRH